MLTSNIKKIMESKKVTIRGMGEKTGLSGETITRARGQEVVQCRLATLVSIANCLGCKVKDLFDED